MLTKLIALSRQARRKADRKRKQQAHSRRGLWLGEQLEPRLMLATDLLRADLATDSILRFDGDTGAPLGTFVSSGSGGLVNPHNPTFGPDGNLYVFSTEAGSEKILKYSGTTGAFLSTFVNTGVGGFAGGFNMEFGPNGDLYVATGGANVLRYNGSTGDFVGVAATGNGITRASGVDFGPDGNLYVLDSDSVTDSAYDRVLRFNPTTSAFIDVFVQPGALEDAISLTFGPDGHLYVPDHVTGRTLSFNGTTGQLQKSYSATGSSIDAFPFFLVFGPDGNLYAPSADRVARFDGETLSFVDTFLASPGETITFFPLPGPAADLRMTIDSVTTQGFIGETVSVGYNVSNVASNPANTNSWSDVFYLSIDEIFDAQDVEIGRSIHAGGLNAGASYSQTLSLTMPDVVPWRLSRHRLR
jgi:streptogramin lyase